MIWLDAHLAPRLALWITKKLGVETWGVRDLGLRDSADEAIFAAAREAGVVFVTKDKDFVEILHRNGPPPKDIWLQCGNTSESRLKEIFASHLGSALTFLDSGESVVEIR